MLPGASMTPAASASSPTCKTASRTTSSRRVCKILLNLDHRGAVGADPKAGDGCGMLVQIPHRFFAPRRRGSGFTLPEPGEYAVGMFFLPRDAEARRIVEAIIERRRRRRGPGAARLARRAGRQLRPRRKRQADRAGDPPGLRRPQCRRSPTRMTFERRLFILRKAVSNDVYNLRDRRTAGFYPVSLSSRTVVYKGMLLANQLGEYFTRPRRSAFRIGAGAGASALFDQHFPDLVAGASLPHGRPQRRDQHAARQRQLDGGAAGLRRLRPVRRRHLEALADLLRGPVGHRLLRQRARIPGAGRLFAGPRDDDADPRGLGRQPADGRGARAPSTNITPR